MSDIELVIKIDEEQYEFIKQSMTMYKVKDYPALLYAICEHVKNGTPLPKGHGRLIDADSLWNAYHDLDYDFYEALDLAETIIEADKKSEE